MRWTQRFRTDVRGVIDRNLIYDHVISMNRAKMRGAGTPCTYFRNTAITFYGTAPESATRCFCWSSQENQPNRSHPLCLGTGYLEGYQKYGYPEVTVATPSDVTKDGYIITNADEDGEQRFIISSPTATQGDILTERFELTRARGFDRFYAKESVDSSENRIEYYYSFDDVTWTEITTVELEDTLLGNKSGSFAIPVGTEYIRFRIRLRKRYGNSKTPIFHSLKFRYRNQQLLTALDPRFAQEGIDGVAFLAAREQQTVEVTQGSLGWETKRPLRWWTLPEVNIKHGDIIQFLVGFMEDQYYEIQSVIPHVHGPSTKLLHTSFESNFLRDDNDVIKVISLLT